MAQSLVRNEDFKTGSVFDNVRSIIYRGNGTPTNRVNAANPGALYIDQLSGQLWISVLSGEPATWRPYFTDITSNVRIASDVQEGDLVGIFGAGSWSVAASVNTARWAGAAGGSQNAVFFAGGDTNGSGAFAVVTSELFNGSIWALSSPLNVGRWQAGGFGSQNAAVVTGGVTTPGNVTIANTEFFNGSVWANSISLTQSVVMSQSKCNFAAFGTLNAGLIAGGHTGGLMTLSTTELFNGISWATGNPLNVPRYWVAGAGTQNAGLVTAGISGSGGLATQYNSTEIFNGSAWSLGASTANLRIRHTCAGSQSAAIISNGTTNLGNPLGTSELFNGSTWTLSGSAVTARYSPGGAGVCNNGIAIAGQNNGGMIATSEIHTQSIYRKLNYSTAMGAINIGLAYNTSNTSFTASVVRGDISGDIVPANTWFGLSRLNSSLTYTFLPSVSATINAISSTITNQASLNLSTTLTGGFVKGGLLLVSNGDLIPIIGGSAINPVVKWENVSTSASTSLTVASVWGQRIYFDPTVTIASGATTITFSQFSFGSPTLPNSLTFSYQGRVGDVLMVPYSTVSGTNGASSLFGTYLITNVAISNNNAVYSAAVKNASFSGTTETNVGGVVLYQQMAIDANTLDSADLTLGFKNKMRIPMMPFDDDFSNGLL